MHPAHPSTTMMVIDDNMMRNFPIIQIEVKIRVPDQLMGRLIGKQGVCLKKIMEETVTHISITEARSQHEAQHYQTPELFDRIITIRGNNWNTVILAEKNVQQKLRQFVEQDMNINANTGAGQYFHGPGVIMNPVDNIGPYIAPGSVTAQILPRDNTYANAAAYNALPMGISPQSFYIQNPAAVSNFSIPTGQYGHTVPAAVPNSVHIKSRVYVPNQIVGILIGTRGQTIRSISAESGALISIEGDHPKKFKKEVQGENNKPESSSNNDSHIQEPPKSDVSTTMDASNGFNMKSVSEVEPISDKNVEPEKNAAIVDGAGNNTTEEQQQKNVVETAEEQQHKALEEEGKKTMSQQQRKEVNGSQQPHNSGVDSQHECHQFNGNKRNYNNNNHQNLPINPDQRGVSIQGYDYQVYKALYWVFQKVSESQNMRADEIVLTCEAIVPSKVIGRIIGKQGQNVKQLQQRSGAHIKVPDDINQHDNSCVDAAVRVVGNFCAVQIVQQHFGTLIMEAEWRESKEYDERERRSRFHESSR